MLVWFLAVTTVVLTGLIALYLYMDHKKQKKTASAEQEIKNQLYELNLIKQITDKIGYSLSIEAVAEAIILTVQNMFDSSTLSYIVKSQDKTLKIKTFVKEGVGQSYLQQVSQITLSGAVGVDPALSSFKVQEEPPQYISQVNIYTYFDAVPLSYFNIPLIFENQLLGMINISSRKKGIYQDADMSILYKIVNAAQIAVGRLHEAIEIEKSKLDSLISSLPAGTIMFSIEAKGQGDAQNMGFNLSVINQAAKNFLKLGQNQANSASVDGAENKEQIDMATVISRFGTEISLGQKIKEVVSARKSLEIQETNINGTPMRIFINPVLRPKDQQIIGVAVVMEDLTLEKKVEKIRENFTNMIVHELRAPSSAIKGASGLLTDQKLGDEDRNKIIHVISESAENMLTTINELLDIGQMEEGQLKIKKEPGDLEKLLQSHIEVFAYAAREKNIAINFVEKTKIPEFLFDSTRIGQVINNVVSNSLKFSKAGGKIDIEISRQDNNVQVVVSDNGIGIPQDKKSILFTKFGQIDENKRSLPASVSATLPGGGSSGLGLYVSKQIVEAHGGRIWIESEEGKGTKVYFTLPIVQVQATSVRPAAVPN